MVKTTVHVRAIFSATLGDVFGLPFSSVKTIFTSVGVLANFPKTLLGRSEVENSMTTFK